MGAFVFCLADFDRRNESARLPHPQITFPRRENARRMRCDEVTDRKLGRRKMDFEERGVARGGARGCVVWCGLGVIVREL